MTTIDQTRVSRRIAYYQTTADAKAYFPITKADGSSIANIVLHLVAGSWAIMRVALSIAELMIVYTTRFAINVAIRARNKIIEHKGRIANEQEVFSSIEPDVKALVHDFIKGVKNDPAKTVWFQRRFQSELVEKLEELSSEFELELNVHKLASAIVKQQAPTMAAAVKLAQERHGKTITRDQIIHMKDITTINKKLEETLIEEQAQGRHRRV